MRILGFSKKWPKLQKDVFTTFRFPRKLHDPDVGDVVQIVYKPRSKGREILGLAEITHKELRWVMNATDEAVKHYGDYFAVGVVTEQEAILDGFQDREDMIKWIRNTYRSRQAVEPMNKFTLRWTQRWLYLKGIAQDNNSYIGGE